MGVPRVAGDIVHAVEERRRVGFQVELCASYVEVFGNSVRDLLGGQDVHQSIVLNGTVAVPVPDHAALVAILQQGEQNKRHARTAMNEHSSRAHTLVIFGLRQQAPEQIAFVKSSLTLVD